MTETVSRSKRQKARILAALDGKQLTVKQLAALLHIERSTAQKYLTEMKAEPRLVRICGYQHTEGRSKAMYALGDAPDQPYRRRRPLVGSQFSQQKARALKALETPRSAALLGLILGVQQRQANVYLRALKKERAIHVAHWLRGGTNPIAFYRAGPGENAPRPGQQPNAAYRQRSAFKQTGWAAALGV